MMEQSISSILHITSETNTKVTFNILEVPTLDSLRGYLKEINAFFNIKSPRDKLLIKFFDEVDEEPIEYLGEVSVDDVLDLFEMLEGSADQEGTLKFSIDIFKYYDEKLSIYSIDKYVAGILQIDSDKNIHKNIKGIIGFFENLYAKGENRFELLIDEGELFTSAFSFSRSGAAKNIVPIHRENLIKNMYDNCNHIGLERIVLCPDDFHDDIRSESLNKLLELFDYIKVVYSTIFISNLSSIEEDVLNFRIDGYKRIKKTYTGVQVYKTIFKIDVDSIYNIYKWVYEENNNLSERIGLARNIVSLHIKDDNDIYGLDKSVLPSIKSGYEIYLKENVDNYINILNQVVLLLNQLDQEAINIADSFSSKFKNNFISFITFFISTILLTTISNGDISNIFTTQVTTISIGFLAISLIYYLTSLLEFNRKIKRLKELYNRNKDQYGIILDTEDLKRIFNIKDDKKEIKEISNLKSSRTMISILWISSLIILLVVVLLSNYNFYIPVQ